MILIPSIDRNKVAFQPRGIPFLNQRTGEALDLLVFQKLDSGNLVLRRLLSFAAPLPRVCGSTLCCAVHVSSYQVKSVAVSGALSIH